MSLCTVNPCIVTNIMYTISCISKQFSASMSLHLHWYDPINKYKAFSVYQLLIYDNGHTPYYQFYRVSRLFVTFFHLLQLKSKVNNSDFLNRAQFLRIWSYLCHSDDLFKVFGLYQGVISFQQLSSASYPLLYNLKNWDLSIVFFMSSALLWIW